MKRVIFCAVAWLLFSAGAQGQSLDQAKKFYDRQQFGEAKPAFERLVKQSPGNGAYNHWYGVCCYETGEWERAEQYFEVGVKRKVQESFRYLAMIYFRSYRFEQAAALFGEYIAQMEKRKQDTNPVVEWKERAERAGRMLDKVERVQVIDSIVTDKDDFIHVYTLSKENGTIMPAERFFAETPADDVSMVCMNQRGDKVFYAQQTDGHYRIYAQSKLLSSWGDEKLLPETVNNGTDSNYPFVLSDGITLYYASTAEGSLGGYDLFVTRYNTATNNYLAPEQLGMPYNSIYNDYMIVFDEFKHLGWFVSDRFQPEDKVCVYLFVVNGERERVESGDMQDKRQRAMVRSIRDTWVEGADYTPLVALAHEDPLDDVSAVKRDFEFVVSRDVIFYTLDEIPNAEARNLYTKYLSLCRQASELEARLDVLRAEYASARNEQRERLRPSIVQAEENLEALRPLLVETEKQARNAVLTAKKAG
ncbi:MAG: tetratricopeptide repeat protein [Tannerellaceae bacterium]|nr:tetratricopeptide repeat protein [Tannerellaceae bacterium]